MPDLVIINPGGAGVIYQNLDDEFTAIEPPLWCRLIGGYCEDRYHSVRIIDAAALGLSPRGVALALDEPLLVCIAAYGHQPSASTQSMVSAGRIARAIKDEYPDLPIIMVGGHAAALPERTLREEAVDYVCTGEGPVTVEELLRYIKADADGLPSGVLCERGGTPDAPLIADLAEDLHGAMWHQLPMGQYRAHNWQCFDGTPRTPYASVYTSLGCPYKCVFCCINAPFGTNRYRMRDPEQVVAEIEYLYCEHGVHAFKIVDEMFVLNQRHYGEICERLAAKDFSPDINIWAYARVDTVKKDKLALLRGAGIRWLALGIESGSDFVRDGAEKSFRDSDIYRIVEDIQKAGINVIGNYIFGLPDDTYETMQYTLNLARNLNTEFANFYSAMAYPGSPLFEQADPADLPEKWSGYSQHSLDTTPLRNAALSARDIVEFRDMAFNEYFTGDRYLGMIDQKFGGEVVDHIQRMTALKLKRGT